MGPKTIGFEMGKITILSGLLMRMKKVKVFWHGGTGTLPWHRGTLGWPESGGGRPTTKGAADA